MSFKQDYLEVYENVNGDIVVATDDFGYERIVLTLESAKTLSRALVMVVEEAEQERKQ